MRRGRIFIFLALIVIIGVGLLFFLMRRSPASHPSTQASPTPQIVYLEIFIAGQNISPGTAITEDMLRTIKIPQDAQAQGEITDKSNIVGKYSLYTINQGVPIMENMLSATPSAGYLPVSGWAPFIPIGQTAVSIPISRLSSTAYGITDGDYVDVIVTMLVVDIDPASQSILPNIIASLEENNGVLKITQGNVIQGHFEMDDISKMLLYIQPSESQRPRMVTQMIMQRVRVLHVGNFPLTGGAIGSLSSSNASPTQTPTPGASAAQAVQVTPPDLITLMVAPQDAVTLTYLVYSGVQITLTLLNPNDTNASTATQPTAANLEYLLTQYNIPIPAKLPYALQPRVNSIPHLPGDVATPHP